MNGCPIDKSVTSTPWSSHLSLEGLCSMLSASPQIYLSHTYITYRYIHTYIHIYIHTYIHTYIDKYIHAYTYIQPASISKYQH